MHPIIHPSIVIHLPSIYSFVFSIIHLFFPSSHPSILPSFLFLQLFILSSPFCFSGQPPKSTNQLINEAFSKKLADQRKEWIRNADETYVMMMMMTMIEEESRKKEVSCSPWLFSSLLLFSSPLSFAFFLFRRICWPHCVLLIIFHFFRLLSSSSLTLIHLNGLLLFSLFLILFLSLIIVFLFQRLRWPFCLLLTLCHFHQQGARSLLHCRQQAVHSFSCGWMEAGTKKNPLRVCFLIDFAVPSFFLSWRTSFMLLGSVVGPLLFRSSVLFPSILLCCSFLHSSIHSFIRSFDFILSVVLPSIFPLIHLLPVVSNENWRTKSVLRNWVAISLSFFPSPLPFSFFSSSCHCCLFFVSCFKRKLKNEIRVAQLSGYISEHAAYHHGEQSLQQTIVG